MKSPSASIPLIALLSSLLMHGCGKREQAGPPQSPSVPEVGYHQVEVFYGTSRAPTGSVEPNEFFGSERGELSYGICQVAIPLDHEIGELEAPSWWKFEFSEDPEEHLMLQTIEQTDWASLSAQIDATLSQSSGKNAFIFIHGYNVTFKDAARRTAQIHHDLSFDGAPIFFSWPSKGEITLTSYTHDETNAKWSYSHLKEFLIQVSDDTVADNLYLVAHSMGTRVLSNAVTSVMNERPDLKGRFAEIILAAPDIDADVFKKDLAPRLIEAARNTTLYANEDDRALMTSRKVHGGYPRAGDAGENLVLMQGIDTIDATGSDSSLLRHSYFAEATNILEDIKELINLARPAAERTHLMQNNNGDQQHPYFMVRQKK